MVICSGLDAFVGQNVKAELSKVQKIEANLASAKQSLDARTCALLEIFRTSQGMPHKNNSERDETGIDDGFQVASEGGRMRIVAQRQYVQAP